MATAWRTCVTSPRRESHFFRPPSPLSPAQSDDWMAYHPGGLEAGVSGPFVDANANVNIDPFPGGAVSPLESPPEWSSSSSSSSSSSWEGGPFVALPGVMADPLAPPRGESLNESALCSKGRGAVKATLKEPPGAFRVTLPPKWIIRLPSFVRSF